MTVADLVERMGGHGAGHLQQNRKIETVRQPRAIRSAPSVWALRVGGSESNERLQLSEGCARVNRLRRQRHRIPQMISPLRGYKGGGGVEQDDVAASGSLPSQDFADQAGVVRGISS